MPKNTFVQVLFHYIQVVHYFITYQLYIIKELQRQDYSHRSQQRHTSLADNANLSRPSRQNDHVQTYLGLLPGLTRMYPKYKICMRHSLSSRNRCLLVHHITRSMEGRS